MISDKGALLLSLADAEHFHSQLIYFLFVAAFRTLPFLIDVINTLDIK
jgi:hypothetical protein